MLFGHQNDDDNQSAPIVGNEIQPATAPVSNPLAVDPDTGVSLPVAPEELEHDTAGDNPVLYQPHDDDALTEPELPVQPPTDTTRTNDLPQPSSDSDSNDLLSLKQQALQQLSPLVNHLDQTPEEKFRTTMMMIQSSDNQSLIKDAYAAAQQISEDKVRAQALLDIVNEINYFTQHTEN